MCYYKVDQNTENNAYPEGPKLGAAINRTKKFAAAATAVDTRTNTTDGASLRFSNIDGISPHPNFMFSISNFNGPARVATRLKI